MIFGEASRPGVYDLATAKKVGGLKGHKSMLGALGVLSSGGVWTSLLSGWGLFVFQRLPGRIDGGFGVFDPDQLDKLRTPA